MTLLEALPRENFRESSTPVLETERLILRAPRFEDAKSLAVLMNDRRIAENTATVPHPYTLADAEAFIGRTQRGASIFLITLPGDIIVGNCGVGVLGGPDPEPGYCIGVPWWGRGIATEAAQALVDFAFTTLGFERLQARARVSNPASRRVLEKCGFTWSDVVLTRVRALGTSVPADRLHLDRSSWAARRPAAEAKLVA
jgi:RimJ/RimL family protein N-acetyltransferase